MNHFSSLLRGFASMSVGASLLASAPSASADETVTLNKTHIMRLNSPAGATVVGNPEIADISVHSDNTLLVFGRGPGTTDILVLDTLGNTLVHTDINVIQPVNRNGVRLMMPNQNNRSYFCNPFCDPAPRMSDEPGFRSNFKGTEIEATSGTASFSSSPPSGSEANNSFQLNSSENPSAFSIQAPTLRRRDAR